MSAATVERPKAREAEKCEWAEWCTRGVTHEWRRRGLKLWHPCCEPHADMARELLAAETRPVGAGR